MLYFIDDLDKISIVEIENIIPTLPEQRREQALKFKFQLGRKTCVLAYQLLCKGLREEYGISEMPIFEYGEHGKPSIVGHENIHFNMSHCKNAVMCYISNRPVGIDVEMLGRGNENLIDYTMSDEEKKQINSSPAPNTEFIRMWTQKEAVLKLQGTGIVDDMKNVLKPENMQGIKVETTVCEDKGYAYSLAYFTSKV